jgi:DNA mismatch endonuclease (patch repair protein)
LPGHPDIVLMAGRKIIFVHGCFWHRHSATRCVLARVPKSRLDFWLPKLESNRRRDLAQQRRLRKLGWSVLVVWECDLRGAGKLRNDPERLAKLRKRLSRFLEGS